MLRSAARKTVQAKVFFCRLEDYLTFAVSPFLLLHLGIEILQLGEEVLKSIYGCAKV